MNAANNFDADLLYAVIRHIPLFLACVAGFVAALFFWRRQRLAAGLVLAGAMLLFLAQAAHLVWEHVFIPEMEMQGAVPEALDTLILYGLPYVSAFGLLLVLAAAFVGRHEDRPGRHFYEDE